MIEDDHMFGRFVRHAVEEYGYTFNSASDMDGFVRAFKDSSPDLVAVDLHNPTGDGIEIMRFLADERYQGPVLIVSGLDRRVLESSHRYGCALRLNMVAPLAKPFRLDELALRLTDASPAAS